MQTSGWHRAPRSSAAAATTTGFSHVRTRREGNGPVFSDSVWQRSWRSVSRERQAAQRTDRRQHERADRAPVVRRSSRLSTVASSDTNAAPQAAATSARSRLRSRSGPVRRVTASESGQRQPSLPALARLIDAAGFELTLGLRRPPGRLRRLSGPVGRRVRRHRKDQVAAAAAHGVSNLRVFGSVAHGEDRPDSDVDLLADFPPGLSLFGLGRLEADLEGILGTRVDLIPAADLKPGVRERVGSDLIPL